MTQHTNIHASLQHLAVAVTDLTPDPKNARKHDRRNLDAIKASLEKFGFRQPLIVQKQGMIVRAGNGRLEVAKELGWDHVPALIVDESEAEAVAYAIADNRTAELAEWDFDNLSSLMESLSLHGDELLASVGFSHDELQFMLVTDDPAVTLMDNAENPTKKPSAQSKEVSVDEITTAKYAHTCPRCGFGFDD